MYFDCIIREGAMVLGGLRLIYVFRSHGIGLPVIRTVDYEASAMTARCVRMEVNIRSF